MWIVCRGGLRRMWNGKRVWDGEASRRPPFSLPLPRSPRTHLERLAPRVDAALGQLPHLVQRHAAPHRDALQEILRVEKRGRGRGQGGRKGSSPALIVQWAGGWVCDPLPRASGNPARVGVVCAGAMGGGKHVCPQVARRGQARAAVGWSGEPRRQGTRKAVSLRSQVRTWYVSPTWPSTASSCCGVSGRKGLAQSALAPTCRERWRIEGRRVLGAAPGARSVAYAAGRARRGGAAWGRPSAPCPCRPRGAGAGACGDAMARATCPSVRSAAPTLTVSDVTPIDSAAWDTSICGQGGCQRYAQAKCPECACTFTGAGVSGMWARRQHSATSTGNSPRHAGVTRVTRLSHDDADRPRDGPGLREDPGGRGRDVVTAAGGDVTHRGDDGLARGDEQLQLAVDGCGSGGGMGLMIW